MLRIRKHPQDWTLLFLGLIAASVVLLWLDAISW